MGNGWSILDDRDSTIKYDGYWDHHNGVAREFRQTTTRPLAPGSKLSFPFKGKEVQVYATYGLGDATSVSFWVDGNKVGSYNTQDSTSARLSQPIFKGDGYSEDDHTFMLTVEAASDNSNLYIDYFLIPNRYQYGGRTGYVFYDDTAIPTLAGSTTTYPAVGSITDQYYSQTVTEMNKGSTATLYAIGTGVRVYGTAGTGTMRGPFASWTLSGKTVTTNYVAKDPDAVLFNHKWYDSGALPWNSYTFKIQSLVDHRLYIDYFIVIMSEPSFYRDGIVGSPPAIPASSAAPADGGANSPSSPAAASSPTSLATTITGSSAKSLSASATVQTSIAFSTINGTLVPFTTTVTFGANPSSGQSNNIGTSQNASTNIGAIIGGVTGGLAVLISFLILLVFLRRHRRKTEFIHPFHSTEQSALPLASMTPASSSAYLVPQSPSTSISDPEELPALKGSIPRQGVMRDRHASIDEAPPGYYI